MNYVIKKVLNSSVVLVSNHENNEFILLGKGIGYGKKAGESIDQSASNQIFVPVENTKSKQFEELMDDIPIDILTITQEIIVEAQKLLECEFNKSLYLILADHLNFAVQRVRDGIVITNRVFWEIKNYYPKEIQNLLSEYVLPNHYNTNNSILVRLVNEILPINSKRRYVMKKIIKGVFKKWVTK